MRISSRIDESMTMNDIFAEISKRQIIGMMFHHELSVMFSFLGLQGFKRLQQYRYCEESREHMKLQFYYIDYCNHIIPELALDEIRIIPKEWYNAERMSVSPNIRKTYTAKAFTDWQEWEKDTKEVLEKYYEQLMRMDKVCEAEYVLCMIKGVSKELKKLEKCMEDMKMVDYDPIYLVEIQKSMHDKYKKKMRIE